MELFFFCRASWSFRAPSLCTNLFWTLRCRLDTCTRHFCCSVTPSLSVLVQTALRPAPRPVAREYPHREPLRKVLSSEPCPSATRSRDSVVPPQRGSDVFLTSPSLHCDCLMHSLLSRRPCHESVLPTSLAHLAVGVSRAWHRLSVTFEMLGLCCFSDAMSSSSWILSFAPSMAKSPLKSAQFVCLSRCHRSSCLFVNCLFEQLDTVDVSAQPRVNVLHWQRS